jgi:hypothetical protein
MNCLSCGGEAPEAERSAVALVAVRAALRALGFWRCLLAPHRPPPIGEIDSNHVTGLADFDDEFTAATQLLSLVPCREAPGRSRTFQSQPQKGRT